MRFPTYFMAPNESSGPAPSQVTHYLLKYNQVAWKPSPRKGCDKQIKHIMWRKQGNIIWTAWTPEGIHKAGRLKKTHSSRSAIRKTAKDSDTFGIPFRNWPKTDNVVVLYCCPTCHQAWQEGYKKVIQVSDVHVITNFTSNFTSTELSPIQT